MKKLAIGKQYILFLLLVSLVIGISIVVIIGKNKVISQLRSDLLKSQMVTVLQHNENEALQAKVTDLEEKSRQKK
jgi:cell division protein FtsB